MRLHTLTVTAFGPFSGTESVDFDTLADAGLFLLCGPTGAGKTSVLDAVSFALYGEVPGDRNSAKRLRSDHAPAGVAPLVVLELTLAGRRLRVSRSPAWQRPKHRGSGTTLQNAKVTLEEHVHGEWTALSTRLDETGHLLTGLLGMTAAQFTQVAMLPQGRFQSFLRARSDERHKVLQQLFRTSRFEDIEKWLVAHRQSLKAANRTHQDAVASVVSRLSEAAGVDLPEAWDPTELAGPAESGELTDWAAGLVSSAAAEQTECADQLAETTAALTDARAESDRARAVADLRARHRAAQQLDSALRDSQDEEDDVRARLEASRRATVVGPLLKIAADRAVVAERTRAGLGPALTAAARLLEVDDARLTGKDLAAAEQSARDAATFAQALLPRERELARARETHAAATTALAELTDRASLLEEERDGLPARLADVRSDREQHAALAAGAAVHEQTEESLAARLAAARTVEEVDAELTGARERLHAAVDAAQAARERLHEIREARINGMAAELATSLAAGSCCPVCGSADHPSPARQVDGAPTRADEHAAREAYEDADFVRQSRAENVATLERNRALAEQAAGGQAVDDLERELSKARTARAAAHAATAELQRLDQLLSSLEAEQERVRAELATLHSDITRRELEREAAGKLVDAITEELSAVLGQDDVADSVARLVESRTAAGWVFAAAREALTAHESAAAALREAVQEAQACAVEHGFATAEEAATVAGADDPASLEAWLVDRTEQRARVGAVVRDPAVQEAVSGPEPDLTRLRERLVEREQEHAAAAARGQVVRRRVSRLSELAGELAHELAAWAPTRSAYAVAHAVSTFAEGKGADNAWQMRLSAYVLAARLRQVVAAANERLHVMSDERYTLEHSLSRGAGELRGGLSLLVRDEWTGESRDPATLSGGETFVASLALALGLADVVTAEAGGTNIDTLFIDEGFGSLDPETLDDVMDTLDSLRDGGRVVGVVSHVPEMRTRITAQLQVRKTRSGSQVVAVREAV